MHNQNSDLSSIDTSSLSLFLQTPKSQLQLKYEQLFRQSSEYRLQIRQLRQDNQWLRTSYEGLQNQSNVLKDLLRQKKEMIVQINMQLRTANEEINRLEDALVQIQIQYKQAQQINQEINRQLKSKNELINKLEYQLQTKNKDIQNIVKEKDTIKNQYQSKERTYMAEMHERATKILQKYSNQKSPSKQQKSSHQTILNELVKKIQSLIQSQTRQKMEYTQQLQSKNRQIHTHLQTISNLQYQLQQATDLMEEYQKQSSQNYQKVKEMQSKLQNGIKIVNKSLEQTSAIYNIAINKLIDTLRGVFKDVGDVLTRIGQIMKTNRNPYQFDIALQQLRQTLTTILTRNCQNQSAKKNMKQLQNRYQILQQEYQTLKLKHMALQRQFEAIIDDNRRILKFNQLSRYRAQRNLRSSNSINNKQNNYYVANKLANEKYETKRVIN